MPGGVVVEGGGDPCCFFPEISADNGRLGLISTPYAFSWPEKFERRRDRSRPVGPDEARIFYAGELDVSESCFAGLLESTEVKVMSDRVWDLAHDQYDFRYLRHQSLGLDLRIMGRTLRSVLGRRGR